MEEKSLAGLGSGEEALMWVLPQSFPMGQGLSRHSTLILLEDPRRKAAEGEKRGPRM